MTKILAPKRLTLHNNLTLERNKDLNVKIFGKADGFTTVRASIKKEDWKDVAEFFARISHDGALL